MSVFIGEKNKRVELAERKDAINPNLLLNSKDFSANWVIGNAEVTSDSYNGGKVVSIHAGGDSSNDVRQQIQTSPSQAVTWSVYAKADNAGDKFHTELFGGGGQTDQALTTDWNRYTFQGTPDPTSCTLYFWGVSGNKGDIYIALPKLEIGNTATPWCPAYDDYAWTSDITNLQNQVDSKTSGTVVTAYDVASKTPTKVTDSYTSEELVDQGALGQFADAINDINGTWNRYDHENGFDLLTLWGQLGIHLCHSENMTNVPDWFTDKRGTAFVFEFDGNSQTIIYASCSTDGLAYYNKLEGKWHKLATDTDLTNLQSMITGLQGQITEIQSKNYIEGYNCANESDAETYSKAHPNTLVTVS